jgi:glycerate 2-kinase
MRIVVAPDSFKEALSATDAASAIAAGIRMVDAAAEILQIPMADGGEGTVHAMVAATGGKIVEMSATGPLGEPVQAFYGVLGDGDTAVVEMAAASGLHLVPAHRRDPRKTTTRGTGELIRHALERNMKRLIVGLGGSATNDAGAGMAQAMGYRLLASDGLEIQPGGAALAALDRVEAPPERPWEQVEISIACDVTNPLTGPQGASRVYGPQKGADAGAVDELDAALAHFAEVLRRDLGVDVARREGAGAAGGLGAGLIAFLGARMKRGVDVLGEAAGLAAAIEGADLVFTAEGRLDAQSVCGKTPVGVARIARRLGVPTVVLAGSLGDGYTLAFDEGVTTALAITAGPESLEQAIAHTAARLTAAAEAVMRLWSAAQDGRR